MLDALSSSFSFTSGILSEGVIEPYEDRDEPIEEVSYKSSIEKPIMGGRFVHLRFG